MHAGFSIQVNEMGENVAFRCGQEGGRHFGIDTRGKLRRSGRTFGKCVQHLRLAFAPMRHQPVEPRGGVGYGRAMSRIEHVPVPLPQFCAGGHEIREVAIGRRHQRRGPAHHVISGKTGVPPSQRNVIAQMAGRMDDLQRPAVAGDRVTVADHLIRCEIGVDAFTATHQTALRKGLHDRTAPVLGAAECKNRRTCGLGQRTGKR